MGATRWLLLGLLALSWASTSNASEEATPLDFGLVDWVKSQKGGFFHSNQEIRPIGDEGKLGIFATQDIAEGEVLLTVPWSIILDSTLEGEEVSETATNDLSCATVAKLLEELETLQGDESSSDSKKYGPFIKYLLSQKNVEAIPSAWSDEGQGLLYELIGGELSETPPMFVVHMLEIEWYDRCEDMADVENTFSEEIAAMVIKKAYLDSLVPLYDMYQHRNGGWYNIKTIVERGTQLQVVARRKIDAGEQLYNSLDMCDECDKEAKYSGFGTPGMFCEGDIN